MALRVWLYELGVMPVRRVVCPGSFDPARNGHLEIVGRASGLYDEVLVAVLINITKHSLFTVDERVEMLREVTKGYGNVRVERFHGLLVEFCAADGITAVVKGLRAVSDFEYEMQMAQMNYRLAKVETLFMTTNPLHSLLSSILVNDLAADAGLIVAELAADARTPVARPAGGCKPGQENLHLRLQRRTGEVICAVLAPSDTIPVLKAPGPAEQSGRGLQIVDVLSDVWG